MKRRILMLGLLLRVTAGAAEGRDEATARAGSGPRPLIQAHAHNDYEHKRPLLDALEHGFCSVEADIHLVKSQLLVAHSWAAVRPERTLQALYLDPLKARVKKNGGRVYAGGPECTLLIDIKTDWKKTYPVLREVLKQYSEMLTTFRENSVVTNAILVIISGDRSKEMFAGEAVRYAAYDGDLSNLDSAEPASFIPWISSSWSKTFRWNGRGEMPESERMKLQEIVRKAHARGRKVRFWGGPDQPVFWREMLSDRVDLINTDDLQGLQQMLAASRE